MEPTTEPKAARNERRADALSREKIVDAAIEILDGEGETALTFRALAARLATGSGAIYWHVANKSELLSIATNVVISHVMAAVTSQAEAQDARSAIRAIALGLFDTIDAHPWAGAQLTREPWQPALVQIFDGIGRQLQALDVPEPQQFDAASALVSYILGVAGQNAANAREHAGLADRATFLDDVAAKWQQLDALTYPFVQRMANQLARHDDRAQFLFGLDLILGGMESLR